MRCRAHGTECRGRRPGDTRSELGSGTEKKQKVFFAILGKI